MDTLIKQENSDIPISKTHNDDSACDLDKEMNIESKNAEDLCEKAEENDIVNANLKEEINDTSGNHHASTVLELPDSNTPQDSSNNTSVVLKAQNSSLSNLLVYASEDSQSSSLSESETYESLTSSENEDDNSTAKTPKTKKPVQETLHTFGDLSLDDLPPVPDLSKLSIYVSEHECVHIGKITGIIDKLVTVESLSNIPAYDLDTLLFLDSGKKPLGYIYDVMGPVSRPIYVIRFNTKEELDNLGVKRGLPVYSAPKTEHTQYVFLKQLMEMKGSDASWMGDNEVPLEHADFSDDEEERRVKRGLHKTSTGSRKRNSLERHQSFEKQMNLRNLVNTQMNKFKDSSEPSTKRYASGGSETRVYHFQPTSGSNFGYTANVPSLNPFSSYMHSGMLVPQHPGGYMSPPGFPVMPSFPPMQNVPLSPNIPPQMSAQAVPSSTIPSQMQNVPCTFPNLSIPPPALPSNTGQKSPQVQSHMLFPPDMGLPRPQNTFVPNMPFYDPRVPNIWSYQNGPPCFRTPQRFNQSGHGNSFPHRP